ncbi:hypothetical protein [Couchioplanes caeruleus]|uniref:Uncharacterized protein n=2 Tax=Couchioplanes caeruleus TaxID=56438 RepID=A0A1K0FBK3_9ACTN|nr:hypothetical protein [Couchioplanes caeruleus]OJF10217.1 hypothetical protein BG844_33220 [Couchioplanes caeruleus subsp. caeruleus]ROP27650.1 hypothetical protein EDD30_0338 [Couchioplanes caeruleus]
MTALDITISLDLDRLARYTDEHLAMLWHVAQANPAPHGDYLAGEAVSRIGFEIIRRWLAKTPAVLHHHQQRDRYWAALCKLAKYQPPEGADPRDPAWHNGTWVPREAAP